MRLIILILTLYLLLPTPEALANDTTTEPSPEKGQSTRYYFLKDLDYGTESNFSPLHVTFNVGFDILRSGSYQESLLKIDFKTGFENVWRNVTSPIDNIQLSGGWTDFLSHEVLPYKAFDPAHGHFVPNWFLHTIGEGMLFRKIAEWYHKHDYPVPYLLSVLTTGGLQILNEVVENGRYRGANRDPIADILIFNPLGWALFSIDTVADLFSSHFKVLFWPGQPCLNLYQLQLLNAAENYAFKVPISPNEWLSLFLYMGSEGLAGLSWRFNKTDALTFAGGYRVIWLENGGNDSYRSMVPISPSNWLGAVFWDRNDSLLFSLQLGAGAMTSLRINLYPGIIEIAGVKLGAFVTANRYDGFVMGISLNASPVGLAVQAFGDPSKKLF